MLCRSSWQGQLQSVPCRQTSALLAPAREKAQDPVKGPMFLCNINRLSDLVMLPRSSPYSEESGRQLATVAALMSNPKLLE